MAELSEEITVRRLPDGQPRSASLERSDRRHFLISNLKDGAEFEAGSLIEIQSEKAIYLGQVLGQQESSLLISIEHVLNRVALTEIENVWQGRQPA
jgi:hypothetical protein